MIKVKTIIPQTIRAFGPDGIELRKEPLNEYEFHDLRVQIKEHSAEGYYFLLDGIDDKIYVDKDGRFEYYPDGMFDLITDTLLKLF